MIESVLLQQRQIEYNQIQKQSASGRFMQGSMNFRVEDAYVQISDNKMQISLRAVEVNVSVTLERFLPEAADKNDNKLERKLSYTEQLLYDKYINSKEKLDTDYWSPENVSGRISDLYQAMGELWKISNPDAPKEKYEAFLDSLKTAIDQGFGQAREVLSGLNILNDVKDIISQTYDLTMQKVDAFVSQELDSKKQA